MGAILGAIVLLCFIVMNPVLLAISLALIVIPFVIAIICHIKGIKIPSFSGSRGRRHSHRRRSKGLFQVMFEGQAQTERRNSSHRGVMSASSSVGARGGKRRR